MLAIRDWFKRPVQQTGFNWVERGPPRCCSHTLPWYQTHAGQSEFYAPTYLTLGRSAVVVDLGASVAWQDNAFAIAHSKVGCQG